ncbi:MAG TPA: hypothetical protein VF746_02325 [Longimicrobium sp.]|jgi:hypothetical protein
MNAPFVRRLLWGALALLPAALAPAAGAQVVYPGFSRSDQSDVTFVSLTTADMLGLEPGVAKSYSCPVAWGVRNAAQTVAADLSGQRLRPTLVAAPALGSAVQADLGSVLAGEDSDVAEDRLAAALTPPESRGGAAAARRLVKHLDGLVAVTSQLNPERPGYMIPSRVNAAVAVYNAYLDAVPESWLESRPEAVLAVGSVLARMVTGAIENHGRTELGASCAPLVSPPPPAVAAPPPPRPFALCVLAASGPVQVYGLIDAERGDSTVVVAGQRRAFREAYPAQPTAASARWLIEDEDMVLGTRTYKRSGLAREILPGRVARFAEYRGVTVYAEPGVTRPEKVYVPVGECSFQEYAMFEARG